MRVLITGCAGFIGFHLAKKLIEEKNYVIGLDNLNNYYDVQLKVERLKILKKNKYFKFFKLDITDLKKLDKIFVTNKINQIVNLAAYAGVEYSLKFPEKYIFTNEIGFFNILENAIKHKVKKIIFASSSSVYGLNKLPFDENQKTDKPISLYAATKKNNEILAYYYHKQFNLNIIGIRFFTVYGPYGRPDLSIFKFCRQIINGERLKLFNSGNNCRDFTYIDDLIENLYKLIKIKSKNNFYKILNISSGKKIKIRSLVKILERYLKKKAKIKLEKKISTDILASLSFSRKLKKIVKLKKTTSLNVGIKKFIDWYRLYYNVK